MMTGALALSFLKIKDARCQFFKNDCGVKKLNCNKSYQVDAYRKVKIERIENDATNFKAIKCMWLNLKLCGVRAQNGPFLLVSAKFDRVTLFKSLK